MRAEPPFQIVPAAPTIGAEIRGLDLAAPLEPAAFEALYAALVEHKVIIFNTA